MNEELSEAVLEVSGVKLHPDAPALEFSMRGGDSLAVLGVNGTGKSRLLAAMIGQVDCAGRVCIGGWDLSSPEQRKKALRRTGVLFQENGLLRDLTVRENVALPANVRGTPEERVAREETEVLLDLCGCGNSGSAYPSELSSGEARRVAIARCLAGGSDILLLDEPVAGLSLEHREQILELLSFLHTNKVVSIIVVFTDDEGVAGCLAANRLSLLKSAGVFGIPTSIVGTLAPRSCSDD